MEETRPSAKEFVIFINKKEFRVKESRLTGEDILKLGGYDPSQYDLFLVQGQHSEQIQPKQSVEMKDGLHFNAIKKNPVYG